MALTGVIESFQTGVYSVSRLAAGTYVNGRYTPGGPTAFPIIGCIQPISGRELESLPEAEHTNEVRVIYTTTELRTRTGANEPDVVTIDGEPWDVIRVERWQAFGGDGSGDHFRAYAARRVVP